MKFCIWDVGDTIYPYTLKPLEKWLYQNSSEKGKQDKKHFDFNPYMRGEVSFKEFCENICDFYNVPFQSTHLSVIDSLMRQGIGSIYPETRNAMHFLKEQGVVNGILSNALPNLSGISLFALPIDKQFVFTSFGFGLLKPDFAIYQRLQKEIGCIPSQIIFVDNKPQNVVAACQTGIKGIVFQRQNILSHLTQQLKIRNHE